MMFETTFRRCVEPVKRNKDGLRWIAHRFEIKGGITVRECWIRDMVEQMMKPSPFMERLK